MTIYAIGDLHLSFSKDKPMDIFGENWENHYKKIKESWLEHVTPSDIVLLTGDTSWALKLEQAKIDLKWIDELPGKKIIIKGNHDYWWSSLSKMNALYESISFIHNNYYAVNEIAICGSRGWICPNDGEFSEHDMKIYSRELERVERSLKKAKQDGYKKIIVMLHYPPTNDKKEKSKFVELFEKYNVDTVLYGHLHTEASFDKSYQGKVNDVHYILTSCDYLDFRLLEIGSV